MLNPFMAIIALRKTVTYPQYIQSAFYVNIPTITGVITGTLLAVS
jgi:hypothetical protein